MSKAKIDVYYIKKARELVDLLVDKCFIRDDVLREEVRALEDYLGFILQSNDQISAETALLMRNIKK